MKKIIAVIVLIVAVVTGIIYIKRTYDNKKFYIEKEKITEYNYLKIKENDKYGVIDKTGKKIVEPSYEQIIIPNPQKDIFICESQNKTIILNSKATEMFSEFEEVQPIKLKNIMSDLSYEKNTLKYKKNSLYGLLNFEGKEISSNLYTSIENLEGCEGKFLVKKEDKYGIMDKNGNQIIECKYDEIVSDGYYNDDYGYSKSGFIISKKTNEGYRLGYANYQGKIVLDCKYNSLDRISSDNDKLYLIASENGKYGLYRQNKQIINKEYSNILYDENLQVLIVEKNKRYGAYNLDGKCIIPIENDEIEVRGIYLYAKNKTQNKVYDIKGKTLDMNFYKSIYKTENSDYFITTLLNNNITYYGIVDKNFNALVEENYRYLEYLFENYFIASNDTGNLGIITSNSNTAIDLKYISVQKIKGKNIVQAINSENQSEFYSKDLKKVASIQKAVIQINEDYIKIYNENEKVYLDNNGQKIENIDNLKSTTYPEKIGDYKIFQMEIDDVYYIK